MEKNLGSLPLPYPVLPPAPKPSNSQLHPHVFSLSRLTHFPVAVPDPGRVFAAKPTLILAIWLLWNCLPSLDALLAHDRLHLI